MNIPKLGRAPAKQDESTFFCFSPPVMIATFLIEIGLAVYTLWRYKLTPVSRLIVLILLGLAAFQLAEYNVCEGALDAKLPWSRIGYIAITFLPPLGLHLLFAIAGVKKRLYVLGAYALAIAFAAFFLFVPSAMDGHACLGNYVIFQVAKNSGAMFGLYYYALLAFALVMGWKFRSDASVTKKQKRAIGGLMFGYVVFIVPTILVNLLNPSTVRGIPSIMCGFAVLLAVMLGFVVLPATVSKKQGK
jgi:hypothetical protein